MIKWVPDWDKFSAHRLFFIFQIRAIASVQSTLVRALADRYVGPTGDLDGADSVLLSPLQ